LPKIKFWINLNEGIDGSEPDLVEISSEDAVPKSRTAHRALMSKVGASKAQRDAYSVKVGLTPE
jgi:hypothetical protein